MVRILLACALVAAVVVPAVHAHALAAPTNLEPPSLVVSPAVASYLRPTPGSWSGAPTSFTYQWLFCPGGGGPADGSACTATTPPLADTGPLLVEKSEIGFSFRVRVAATNVDGSTSVVSDASPAAIEPDLSFITGCPTADQAGPVSIDQVMSPARLEVDARASTPAVITGSTQRLILRFHVIACDGKSVRGARVYATPTPFQQFIGPERSTGPDGWASITLTRERFFPATPRQQNLIVFVRASKAGQDLLGGISTRRLVSFPVRLS
jgi:hypothetical protein